MNSGTRVWPSWLLRGWLGLGLGLLAGCAADRSQIDRALMRDTGAKTARKEVLRHYVVRCPDVLSITVLGKPELDGLKPVGADGRIELANLGRLRVEGKTFTDIQQVIGEVAFVSPRHVGVKVADFKSQQIYVFGQVIGLQRAVPYQGPEKVTEVLQRAGGITAGASSNDVYVVRPHLIEGKQPEVFHVDLKAILTSDADETNVTVEPFDEIYVGETRHSCLEKCIPKWMRPLYESLCGLTRILPFSEKLLPRRQNGRHMTLDSRQHAIDVKPARMANDGNLAGITNTK